MDSDLARYELHVHGLVQGVGFRYFVYREAVDLGLKGFVKNLYSGEVFIIAEGKIYQLEELFNKVRIGPAHAHVRNVNLQVSSHKNEFKRFEIRY